MELDPIVLLAYVSVAINIITVIAAAVAYAIFRIRRRRRRPSSDDAASSAHVEPVFLRPYLPSTAVAGQAAAESKGGGAFEG